MEYEPRHAVRRAMETARRLSWPARTGAVAVAVAGLAGGGMALAGGAGATQTSGIHNSLQSSSDGAVARWTGTNEGTLKLTVGSQTSTTFAEMSVEGIPASAPVPAGEPRFNTDNYNAGSPRWVIDLSNDKSLEGYPGIALSGGTGPDSNGMAWSVGNGGTYTDYTTAYNNAGAGDPDVTVTAAFIVADGDQAAGTTDTLTNVNYDEVLSGSTNVPPTGPVCYDHSSTDPTAACAWQELGSPGGYNLDVKGQVAASGTPIIAYRAKSGDPAVDLSVVAAAGDASGYQLEYTPYGNYTDALQHSTTVADSAYSSTGTPLYCVSGVADSAGQSVQLRGCAPTTNQWQDLNAVQLVDGSHRAWEPNYATTNNNPMALNDKGYGGDGSPIINWAPSASFWNEEFYPANAAAAG